MVFIYWLINKQLIFFLFKSFYHKYSKKNSEIEYNYFIK